MMNDNSPKLENRLIQRERPVNRSPVMNQSWHDLLFLHWQFPADKIQGLLPPGLHVDTYNDMAWVGITPFFMKDVRARFMPKVPFLSDFLETNVRTYAYDDKGTAGIWFFSLDANQPLAVEAAREFFFLPYKHAAMSAEKDRRGQVDYKIQRNGLDESLASRFVYRPRGNMMLAEPGSLEFFLLERYVLFAWADETQRLFTGKIHHKPHPMFDVELTAWDDSLIALDGLAKPGREPDHLIYSQEANVEIFTLERVK